MNLSQTLNKSLQFDATKQQVVLNDLPSPVCPQDGVLLELDACGFCGSDLDKIRKAQVSGILGHELVGRIIDIGETASAQVPFDLKLGHRLAVAHHVPCGHCHYCQHHSPSMCEQFKSTNISPGGFSNVIAISGQHLAHTAFLLQPETSSVAATAIEPLACCIRAIHRLLGLTELEGDVSVQAPQVQSMAMIGLGFIGLLSSWAAQDKGFEVYGLDLKPERLELARSLNWLISVNASSDELYDVTQAKTEGRGVDVVFLTVVTLQTIQQALKLVRNGGKILIFAGSPSAGALLEPDVIYHRELTVLSSYSPSLKSLQEANDAIQSGRINVMPLLKDEVLLAELPDAIERYASGESLKLIVRPSRPSS